MVMKRTFCLRAGLVAALLMIGTTNAVFADDGGRNGPQLRTRLAGAAIHAQIPEGSAKFRSSTRGSQLNVEVEHVRLPAGTMLGVAVSRSGVSVTIGTITLASTGEGELELDSRQGDTVPSLATGDMVTVNNGGTTILAGVL
jgi:hypothetical protein